MSDISDCIVKILADNGVSAEQKEIWTFAGKAENVIQLDFSEHDKPFEDKIEKLEKELSALRRRCNSESALHAFDVKSFYRLHIVSKNTEDENTELKKQVDKLEDKNKNLVNMINEIQLEKAHIDCDLYNAKQRIAELESEKSEKPVAYVLAKEIDGQHYVTVEDFMSVVNNLLRQRAD